MKRLKKFIAASAFALLVAANLPAQSIYGTLTGIISDPSGAVIVGATLKLRDEQSGSQRDTVANSDGYYTFVSVPPGSYQLSVEAKGFEGYKEDHIVIGGGDKLNVNVGMKVGNASNIVEVTASSDLLPVDSGEKSNRLTSKELENFVQLGSNAAEFIKIMPGFGISNGTSNTASYNGQTIGINGNGNGGNQSPLNGAYSYNGLPGNSLDITADGAHVSDPGCNCATPVNPNSDMISEFKVTMSNFSAENQKGPGVISSVAKGGGTRPPRLRVHFRAQLGVECQRLAFQLQPRGQTAERLLLPRLHDRRSRVAAIHQVQQEAGQAVLLYRLRILLSGAGHRSSARHRAHRGRTQRRFLAG